MANQDVYSLMTHFINAVEEGKDSEFPHKLIIEQIQTDLQTIQSALLRHPDSLTKRDLDKLIETLESLKEKPQECLTRARKRRGQESRLTRRYTQAQAMELCPFKKDKLKANLKKWEADIKEIREKISESSLPPLKSLPSKIMDTVGERTSSVFDDKKIHGWGDKVKEICGYLAKDSEVLNTVGIVGMFGAGKTTLAQKVFADEDVVDRFPLRLWVWVSKDCGPEELLRRTLDNLGVEREEIESALKIGSELDKVGVLLFLLHLQLLDKRYLIVFDDVREVDVWHCNLHVEAREDKEWDRLAHGLPKGSGGAVIVTSRNEDDARKMVGRGAIHTPNPLPLDDGWELFKEEYTAAGKVVSPKLEKMKDLIIQKCAGFPEALKIAARNMTEELVAEEENQEKKEEKPAADDDKKKEEEQKANEAMPKETEEKKTAEDEKEKGKETPNPKDEKKDDEAMPKETEEKKTAEDEKKKGKETPTPQDEKKEDEAMPKETEEKKSAEDEQNKGKENPTPPDEKKEDEAMPKETEEKKTAEDEKEQSKGTPTLQYEKKDDEAMPKEIEEKKTAEDEKEKSKDNPTPQDEKKDDEAMPKETEEKKTAEGEKEKGKETTTPQDEKKDDEAMQKETGKETAEGEKEKGKETASPLEGKKEKGKGKETA